DINNLDAGWVNLTDNIAPGTAIRSLIDGPVGNMRLAVSAAAPNPVYVALSVRSQLAGIFRSANQGGTWTAMDLPQTLDASRAIASASNTADEPTAITVANPYTNGSLTSIVSGDRVRITGNSLVADGDYTITVVDATHFTLDGTHGTGGAAGAGG